MLGEKCHLKSVNFLITFLTQHLGLSIFDTNLGCNNRAVFIDEEEIS